MSLSPKYGRLQVASLEELVQRLTEVEQFFKSGADFSIYGADANRNPYYGLKREDLTHAARRLVTITATCQDNNGKSVNITLKKVASGLEGQFIALARTRAEQRELTERLQGTWIPLSEEEKKKRGRISQLIASLRHHLKAKERIQRQLDKIPPPRATEPARPIRDLSIDKFPLLYDTFPFDHQLAPEVFIHLMEQLRLHFFQDEDFYFRTVNKLGEPHGDLGIKGVEEDLTQQREDLKRIYVEIHTSRHEWMTLQLDFGYTPEEHRAELEVSSRRNKQIQATIRDTLEKNPDLPLGQASMIHEMFSFEPNSFELDQVARLLKALTSKYLGQEVVTAFLSTYDGETYSGLRLKRLRQIYQLHKGEVSFLLFGVNQADSGQTFSLMFQFGGMGQQPHGSISMMWGHHGTHQAIRALVWRELQLTPYRPRPMQPGIEPLSRREMRVKPAFYNRDFQPEPLNALVLMQLEAYWSDSIWELLQHELSKHGFSAQRGEALFSKQTREAVWTQLNEVDLVIVDLTYKHPSVFYYLGVAHTLGIRTILISQLDRDIPADFSDFATVVYDNNLSGIQYLQEELEKLLSRKG